MPDRSNMRVVQTTDKETRQAFKARLVEKIAEKEAATPPTPHPLLGTQVSHPSLGVCTVQHISEEKNFILLNTARGLLDLVLSQTLPFLSPAGPEGRGYGLIEDHPIESFSPTNWVRPDQPVAYLEREDEHIEKTELAYAHIPVGSLVWHPDFGACTITEVNPETNSLVLDGVYDLVLSVAERVLRPVGEFEAARHVAKPFTKLELPKKAEPQPEPFSFLPKLKPVDENAAQRSREEYKQRLANKVDASTTMERTSEPPSVVATASSPPGVLSLPTIFKSFSDKDRVTFLRNTKQLTWDEVNDAGQGVLTILYTDEPEAHQPYVRPVVELVVVNSTVAEEIPPKTQLTLHPDFSNWRPWQQKLHLTREHHLTTEQAAAFLIGDTDNYEITWKEETHTSLPTSYNPVRVEKITQQPVSPALSDKGVERVTKQIEVVETTVVSQTEKLSVVLPEMFKHFRPEERYTFLTKTKRLTPEEANDFLAVYSGRTPWNTAVEYEILWD